MYFLFTKTSVAWTTLLAILLFTTLPLEAQDAVVAASTPSFS